MTIFLPRSAWTNHGPVRPLTRMSAAPLRGFAIHWPGNGEQHIDATNPSHIAGELEGERKYHVRPGGLGVPQGGNDIAYQYAVDLLGRVWELRGINFRSGANGSSASNQAYGAVTLLLGTNDIPSAAMIQAVRDFRRKVWLTHYPKATRVIGHRDVYSTGCPGPHAYPLVRNGTFVKAPPPPKPPPPPPKPPQPPKPPTPPKHVRTPLMTNYVYGDGTKDSQSATAVAALFGLSQLFNEVKAKAAADQGNPVLVLGGPATTALGLKVPVGATTTVGNFRVALGLNGEETLIRGVAAAKTLPAG